MAFSSVVCWEGWATLPYLFTLPGLIFLNAFFFFKILLTQAGATLLNWLRRGFRVVFVFSFFHLPNSQKTSARVRARCGLAKSNLVKTYILRQDPCCRIHWKLVLSVLLGWEKWLWPPYQLWSHKASTRLQINKLQQPNLWWQIWDEARGEETRQQGWEGKHESDPHHIALQGSPGFAWDWLGLPCLCAPPGGGG